ncbi:Putative prefoldin subunit 3, partial [Verticillium dahliae VDG2]
ASAKDKDRDAVTIEDLTLPRSIITRLAKGVLPPGTQIQANAILALNKSAAVFVNYLATHANEHTLNAGKKTIDPTHVFKALEDTELSFLKEPLEAEFASASPILSCP